MLLRCDLNEFSRLYVVRAYGPTKKPKASFSNNPTACARRPGVCLSAVPRLGQAGNAWTAERPVWFRIYRNLGAGCQSLVPLGLRVLQTASI